MFGIFKKKSAQRALEGGFQKMERLLTDDDMQIRVLGPQGYSQFRSLTAIDCHPNGEGEFGRSLKNPIPTNGPIGSIAYLSSLGTTNGHRILFHRVKVFDNIDVYEYVALSGGDWDFLFVDMYHSRKSKLVPSGFRKLSGPQQLIGFNHFWDDFPFGYAEQKEKVPRDLRLLYVSIDSLAKEMRGRHFERPEMHEMVLQSILEP